jgi:hypothetical protein
MLVGAETHNLQSCLRVGPPTESVHTAVSVGKLVQLLYLPNSIAGTLTTHEFRRAIPHRSSNLFDL